jgi:hypothetical protein
MLETLTLIQGALPLSMALGNVVHYAVASNVRERLFLLDIAGARADYNTKLHFPVGLL